MRDGWVETTLGDVADISIGKTPPRKDDHYWTLDLDRPFCTIADMDGPSILPVREGVTALAEEEGKAKRVPRGSLLMSFKLTIGRVGVAGTDLFPNEAIAWIQPRSPDLHLDFLGMWLGHQDLEEHAGRAVKGKTLNGPALRGIPVSVPPLQVQHRIVDLVTLLDDASEKVAAAIAATETAIATASLELVPWERADTSLGQVATIESALVDPTLPEHRDLPHVGVERILARVGELLPLNSAQEDRVTSGKFLFSALDVVYSKIRPELRKVAMPGLVGLCSADAYPLRPGEGISREYLYELLLSQGFADRSVAKSGRTKMPKINREELFSIQIAVPTLSQQDQIVGVLGGLRAVRRSLVQASASTVALRRSLLDDLLSGAHEIPASYDALLEHAS